MVKHNCSHLLRLLISYQVLRAPNIFLMFFGDFIFKNKKESMKKQCFKILFKAGQHMKAGQLPEGYLNFVITQ